MLATCPAAVSVSGGASTARRAVGGKLKTEYPHEILDHLDYRGRYGGFRGALVSEFVVWMLAQLGAQSGDEAVYL